MICCAQIPLRGMNFHRTRQCTRPGIVERDGMHYCGIHDPVAKAEKAAKLEPQKKATRARNTAMYVAMIRAKKFKL